MTNLANGLHSIVTTTDSDGGYDRRLYFRDASEDARMVANEVSPRNPLSGRERAERNGHEPLGHGTSGAARRSSRLPGTCFAATAGRVGKAVGFGLAAAAIGVFLSPDIAFASGIDSIDSTGQKGITIMKGVGYLCAVLGTGAAGMGWAAGMNRGLVGTAGAVGGGGALAVGADAAGINIFGAAPAADLSILHHVSSLANQAATWLA